MKCGGKATHERGAEVTSQDIRVFVNGNTLQKSEERYAKQARLNPLQGSGGKRCH